MLRIALVHDYLVDPGGAERVLLQLHRLFPDAPIYTSIYNKRTTFPEFRDCDIRVSPLQFLTTSRKWYKWLLLFYPLVFRSMDLSEYDVVISSKSAFSNSVRTGEDAIHLCYCYTPPRFVWFLNDYRKREAFSPIKATAVQAAQPFFRRLDLASAQRVDHFWATCVNVQRRITAVYHRPSSVVYAPVELERFRLGVDRGDRFLIVSRLNRYKNVDMAIEAFNQLQLPLDIAGDGPDAGRLRALAGPTVRLLGRVTDAELQELYSTCRALILPGEEDWGLTPLEANASGAPVIALGRGGALETVVPGRTGVFFAETTSQHLVAAVGELLRYRFDPRELREHAGRFGVPQFRRGILETLRTQVGDDAVRRAQ